ncbi:MAG: hypothetical protein H5U40_14035 [Polyangiaceae bacterium]|nr:hypothetical protein [Polyangiaceae bacterium]
MYSPPDSDSVPRPSLRVEKLIAAFGVLQVSLFLGFAIYRLTPVAVNTWLDGSLSQAQRLLFVGWVAMNLYTEGYRGFHKRFCPRVVSRAVQLGRDPRPLDVLLALPFCMSLIRATRRQLIARWTFVTALYTMIYFVRKLPMTWRGIIDGGVVVGLAYGVVSLWWIYSQYAIGRLELLPAVAPEPRTDVAVL